MAFAERLYPICRSITGNGIRETLRAIAERTPLEIHEVPTGTPVLDWTVPKEWNIADAYIKDQTGKRVVDFKEHNLHVLNYSVPVHEYLPWRTLKEHLYSIPDRPDWIPYRTSYYSEKWGFCLSHRTFQELEAQGEDAAYEVCIDATLEDGFLSYGEIYLPGEAEDEILLSCHACHPSLANDNLSGIALATELAEALADCHKRHSYRFLFIPGTIGSITWLARNRASVGRVKHGLVLTCIGDRGPSTYKQSRSGNAPIDRAAAHVLGQDDEPYKIEPFIPYGYDERQYCSPGFDLSVGCLMRTPNGKYPEYHTSADGLDLISAPALSDSLRKAFSILDIVDSERKYRNLKPFGEPQLGKRGLYRPIGGEMGPGEFDQMAILWVLNLSDGTHSLLDIAERARLPFDRIRAAAQALAETDLLEEMEA